VEVELLARGQQHLYLDEFAHLAQVVLLSVLFGHLKVVLALCGAAQLDGIAPNDFVLLNVV